MNVKSRAKSAAACALFLSAAATCPGAVFIQELFDDISIGDSTLDGKGNTASTIGLTGNWVASNGGGIRTANNNNLNGDLPGLPPTAGAQGLIWNSSGSWNTNIYATKQLNSTIDFSVSQTIYFSVRLDNTGNTSMGIGLSSGTDGSAEFVHAGLTWGDARPIGTVGTPNLSGDAAYIGYGTVGADSGPYGIRSSGAQGSVNNFVLLVGRLTINAAGNDLIDIITYGPSTTIAENPGAVAWSVSEAFDSSMTASHLLLTMNGANQGQLDAIRFGTTWADVTGVPEPASAALGALGVLGLLRRRR